MALITLGIRAIFFQISTSPLMSLTIPPFLIDYDRTHRLLPWLQINYIIIIYFPRWYLVVVLVVLVCNDVALSKIYHRETANDRRNSRLGARRLLLKSFKVAIPVLVYVASE